MDFSTLDKRRRACERELAVNEVDAPGLYLGVVPISKDGFHLKFGGGASTGTQSGRAGGGQKLTSTFLKVH
jgi:aminoglycoside phosphotransferase family enzyme